MGPLQVLSDDQGTVVTGYLADGVYFVRLVDYVSSGLGIELASRLRKHLVDAAAVSCFFDIASSEGSDFAARSAIARAVLANRRQVASVTTLVAPELERSAYVWIASLLFIGVCALWRPVPGIAWEVEGAGAWVLRVLQATGLWLTLRSAAILNVRELAGLEPVGGAQPGFESHGGAPRPLHIPELAGYPGLARSCRDRIGLRWRPRVR